MKLTLQNDVPIQTTYNSIHKNLSNKNWITDSESPYSSVVVQVSKKYVTMRLFVDYCKFNAKTIQDRLSFPWIKNVIGNLGGSQYFTWFDLGKTNQLHFHPGSNKMTVFITP